FATFRGDAIILVVSGRSEQRLIARNPGEPWAYKEVGLSLIYLGRPEEALDWFTKAERFGPRDPGRWSWFEARGQALLLLGRDEDAVESRAGTQLVVLEGHMQSGKTTLTKKPFSVGAGQSVNIELDDFRNRPVPEIAYIDTIDQAALENELRAKLASAPLVIVQGAIAWPLVEPMITATLNNVRDATMVLIAFRHGLR